ncbi:MAG: GntR family transcriptional regulator, partial [Xanthomonadales bacterium]|nr:GntR family transcriptional regulator [Xanthomonadales bacterium]
SKSYQALVDDGLVEKRRGLGMFVREGARDGLMESERARFLNEEWPTTLSPIEQLGLDVGELLKQARSKKDDPR